MNGFIAAFITCFFLVHGLLGSIAGVVEIPSAISWIAWIGLGIVGAHVIASIRTSYLQLTDAQFPPSARKKRHLALKWTTGILLAAVASVHVACAANPEVLEGVPAIVPACGTIVLSTLLVWHICVGMKSLLTDISLPAGLLMPLRIIVCVLAVAFAAMAVASVVL